MWSALEHAAAGVCGFVRRHKRLVLGAGVAAACAAGAYYGYRRVQSEAERYLHSLQRQLAEHQRLQLSLASTTEESNATIRRFLPRLKRALYARVDLEALVQELKGLDKAARPRRNALWDQAKRVAVTRYFTALLAFGLWHLLVFAQIAIIGKRTFERSKREADDGRMVPDEQQQQQAQHEFLASGLEYFLDEGIARIHEHVERVVAANELLQSWDVSRKLRVERDELNELLQEIYLAILPPSVPPSSANLTRWQSFLIYADKKPGQSEAVISLLNDLWDLLDSDLFGPALQHSLGFLCGNAFQDLNEVVYGITSSRLQDEDPLQEPHEHNQEPREDPEQQQQPKRSPPLAKLIPALQTEVNKLLAPTTGQDSYLAKYSQGVGEIEAFRGFYEAIFFDHVDDHGGAAMTQLI